MILTRTQLPCSCGKKEKEKEGRATRIFPFSFSFFLFPSNKQKITDTDMKLLIDCFIILLSRCLSEVSLSLAPGYHPLQILVTRNVIEGEVNAAA